MNKKKALKYLAINELENKVFKEQKQERKRHGNKRQEGETARKADYISLYLTAQSFGMERLKKSTPWLNPWLQ